MRSNGFVPTEGDETIYLNSGIVDSDNLNPNVTQPLITIHCHGCQMVIARFLDHMC